MKGFNVGDKIEVDIVDINSEGMGVGRYEGFTFFIDGSTIGDRVMAEIVGLRKRFGICKTIGVLDRSTHRVKSKCIYFPECDGCQLHNLDYERQLEFKKDMLANNLKRIGRIEGARVRDTIGMEYPYEYRNKAEFKVGPDLNMGYFKRGSHNILPIDRCIIQNEMANRVMARVKEYMERYDVQGYNRKSRRGTIRNVLIRTNGDGQAMVVIVTKHEDLPHKGELVEALISQGVISIYQNINTRDTSLVLGPKDISLYGEGGIVDSIGEYKFLISPKSFFQVNSIQTKVLYDKLVEYLDLKGNETLVDLYCGIGTIAIYISEYAKKVYGVEIVKEAIEDANENLRLNQVDNVEFIEGKSEDVLPRLNSQGIKIDAIIVDPPRRGLDKSLIDSIAKANPERIVYVSCNPSTLARDLGYLQEKGYKVEEVQPVDMFPMTVHVECVIKIQRVK